MQKIYDACYFYRKDNMNNETFSRYETTLDNILTVLGSINQKDINTVPFEGSWTAGQVVDHIIKSMSNIGHVLTNDTKPTDRQFDQHKGMMENIFLNNDHKMKSPDFIIPTNEPVEKNEQIKTLQTIKEAVLDIIKTLDLTELCTSFEMPGLGMLTRYELIWFVIYHTQRHTHQLEKIRAVLNDK